MIDYEKKIMKEFQYADYKIYKNLRIAFLESFLKSNIENQNNIKFLIDFLNDFRPLQKSVYMPDLLETFRISLFT